MRFSGTKYDVEKWLAGPLTWRMSMSYGTRTLREYGGYTNEWKKVIIFKSPKVKKEEPVKCLKQEILSFPEAGTAAVVKSHVELPATLPSSALRQSQRHNTESKYREPHTFLQAGSAVSSDWVAQGITQPGLRNLWGWRLHSLSGHPLLEFQSVFLTCVVSSDLCGRTWVFQALSQATSVKSSLWQV